MNFVRSRKVVKIATIVGCMLFAMPCGLPWYWGNLSVYTLSYVVSRIATVSGAQALWVMSGFMISDMIGLIIYGTVLSKYCDKGWIFIAALAITEASFFLTYFAVQKLLVLVVVTLGIVHGFGTGLLYANGIQLIVEQAGKDMGLLTSVYQSSFPAGALVINWGLTWYTNPNNETPQLKLGSMIFFTQKDVLDKVPSMYLILGVFSLVLQIIGILLLQLNPSVRLFTMGKSSDIGSEISCKLNEENSESSNLSCSTNATKEINYSPREMLKAGSFFLVWFSFFTGETTFLILTNYYKSYGQLWIHDDHFLTNVGTAFIFVSIFARLVWGTLIDKLGLKTTVVAMTSAVVVLNSIFYFTPMLSRLSFVIVTLIYVCCSCPLYNVYLAATVMLFGKKHAAANFSFVMTASIVINFLAPPVVNILLTNFGWFSIFALASVLNTIDVILLVIFLR